MNKSKLAIVIALIAVSMVTLVGSSYALFTKSLEGTKKVSIQTGTLKVDFSEGDSIKLENSAPMSDSAGQSTTPYTFTVTNSGNIKAYYSIMNEEDSANSTLSNTYLKYRLVGSDGYDSGVQDLSSLSNNYFISASTLDTTKTVSYKLYMWISSTAGNEVQGKTYQSKIVVQSVSNLVKYYTFGNPTEASETSYIDVMSTTGSSVFNQLYATEKSVCIYQNNTLNCFKNNNYTEEKTNMLNAFGTTSCTTTDTGTASETTSCINTKFSCTANINGTVSCIDITNNKSCKVDQTDSATCGANQ